jgi:hypothetical protein
MCVCLAGTVLKAFCWRAPSVEAILTVIVELFRRTPVLSFHDQLRASVMAAHAAQAQEPSIIDPIDRHIQEDLRALEHEFLDLSQLERCITVEVADLIWEDLLHDAIVSLNSLHHRQQQRQQIRSLLRPPLLEAPVGGFSRVRLPPVASGMR